MNIFDELREFAERVGNLVLFVAVVILLPLLIGFKVSALLAANNCQERGVTRLFGDLYRCTLVKENEN